MAGLIKKRQIARMRKHFRIFKTLEIAQPLVALSPLGGYSKPPPPDNSKRNIIKYMIISQVFWIASIPVLDLT